MACDKEDKELGCDLKQFERNNYFYGKLMTVRDFEAEQDYFNDKRHLINRLIHGIGIVCGLEVEDEGDDNGDKPEKKDGSWYVWLNPGVAIDCCGQEIVVSKRGQYKVNEEFKNESNALYLKYDECQKDTVLGLSNISNCEEECCPSRIGETFTLKWGPLPEDEKKTDIPISESKENIAQNYYEENLLECPKCDDAKVFLGVFKESNGSLEINKDKIDDYRSIVYNNPMLYDLMRAIITDFNEHVSDFENPHKVKAKQIGALVSVKGLSNPGGNIDLLGENYIEIKTENPANKDPKIIIKETVTAEKLGALKSINKILGGSNGNISLKPGSSNITIAHSEAEPNTILIDSKIDVDQNKIKLLSQYIFERTLKATITAFKSIQLKLEDSGIEEGTMDYETCKNIWELALKFVSNSGFVDENSFKSAIRTCIDPLPLPLDDLNPGKITKPLRKALEENEIYYSSNAEIVKLDEDTWLIDEEQVYDLEKNTKELKLTKGDKKLNLYKKVSEFENRSLSENTLKLLDEDGTHLSPFYSISKTEKGYEIRDRKISYLSLGKKRACVGISPIEDHFVEVLSDIENYEIDGFLDFKDAVKRLGEMENSDILEIAIAQDEVCFYASLMEFVYTGPN